MFSLSSAFLSRHGGIVDVGADAHDGGDGLGDNARILILEPDDLLLDLAPLRLDLRVLLRHL